MLSPPHLFHSTLVAVPHDVALCDKVSGQTDKQSKVSGQTDREAERQRQRQRLHKEREREAER